MSEYYNGYSGAAPSYPNYPTSSAASHYAPSGSYSQSPYQAGRPASHCAHRAATTPGPPPANNTTAASGRTSPGKSGPNKLASFLVDCVSVGTLNGFRHFDTNEKKLIDSEQWQDVRLTGRTCPLRFIQHAGTIGNKCLKAMGRSKVLLRNASTTKLGGNYTAGLPPASPAAREIEKDTSRIAFLIAGYARYKAPFVWIRSNHKHLIKISEVASPVDGENGSNPVDQPVRLTTTQAWSLKHIHLSQIISEIIRLSLPKEKISNPWKIEEAYFENLSPHQTVLETAAMIEWLRKVHPEAASPDEVMEDIRYLSALHFHHFQQLLIENAIVQPVSTLQQQQHELAPATQASISQAQATSSGIAGVKWGGAYHGY